MSDLYFEEDYAESDYVEGYVMAIDALPSPPLRSDPPSVFIEKADAFMAALAVFAQQADAVAIAMNNNATNAESSSTLAIGTGNKTFIADAGKSYVNGQTVRAAATTSPTVWMQGDLIAYNSSTGELNINMNTVQGSGTYSAWTISLSNATTVAGSLTQDFSVQSLIHAIGVDIASASTIDLSAVAGNTVHVTGNNTISAVTMTAGKDVLAIFDGTPLLDYHATNMRLNSGAADITAAVGGRALFHFDGTTVWVTYFRPDGKANVETAAPAGAAVGSGLIHFGSTPPANYLACPTTQTNLNRTTYNALFIAIGTTWGIGDNSTTFGMPWFPSGYAMLQANTSVSLENVGKTTVGENLAHTHTTEGLASTGLDPAGAGIRVGTGANIATGSSGGSANLAAGHRVLICVKYQ